MARCSRAESSPTRVAEDVATTAKAVAAGQGQFSSLTDDERVAAHAMVDARIGELAAAQSFGAAARDEGHATVSLDEDGNLIEIGPDGTRRPL